MNESETGEAIEILLVEDNPGDVRLTREALRDGKVTNRLNVVDDGEKALACLRGSGEYRDARRPDMVLLDLNLPKKGGREVLAEIKSDPALKNLAVVILTNSPAEEEILKAYNLDVDCFITKPVDLVRLLKAVKSIDRLWFSIVKPRAD